jgi:uncharacterized metal-binding protein
VGQIADSAARTLARKGTGQMWCAIAIGAQNPSFTDAAKQMNCVAIDGCDIGCVAKVLKNAGIAPRHSVVVTSLGIQKSLWSDPSPDDIARVVGAVAEALGQH